MRNSRAVIDCTYCDAWLMFGTGTGQYPEAGATLLNPTYEKPVALFYNSLL